MLELSNRLETKKKEHGILLLKRASGVNVKNAIIEDSNNKITEIENTVNAMKKGLDAMKKDLDAMKKDLDAMIKPFQTAWDEAKADYYHMLQLNLELKKTRSERDEAWKQVEEAMFNVQICNSKREATQSELYQKGIEINKFLEEKSSLFTAIEKAEDIKEKIESFDKKI